MAEGDRTIKVQDFRMFTPEGDLKPEYKDLESASPEPPAPPPAPSVPEPKPAEPTAAAPPGPEDADFVALVGSLYNASLAALGLLAEPGSRARVDVAGARRMIDWLAALERKTRNNLSFSEQNLLAHVLYELRLACVEAEGAARPAPRG